jgi:hypothetical protein
MSCQPQPSPLDQHVSLKVRSQSGNIVSDLSIVEGLVCGGASVHRGRCVEQMAYDDARGERE